MPYGIKEDFNINVPSFASEIEAPPFDALPMPPRVFYPWRRYFARISDLTIYGLFWDIILAFVFQVNLLTRTNFGKILDLFVIFVIMLFLEPLLLHRFGTTLGKAIWGLRITHEFGRNLSYSEGLARTKGVIGKGMGYNLPIYNLIRLWKSYRSCQNNETQSWEQLMCYFIKDTKWFRVLPFITLLASSFMATIVITKIQELPPNRGDITVAEFAENYNYYARYLGLEIPNNYLDKEGSAGTKYWNERYKDTPGYTSTPVYTFILEDGYITGVSLSVEAENTENIVGSYDIHKALSSMAFICAGKEVKLFSPLPSQIIKKISATSFEDFRYEIAGFTLSSEVKYSGYTKSDWNVGYLWLADTSSQPYFHLTFSITK